MNTLRKILGSFTLVAAACTLPVLSVGCGAEAVSEGELDPQEVVAPPSDERDETLRELGFDTQKRGLSGNVNYLAGNIPVGSGSVDDVKTLVLSRLAATYQLASGTDLKFVSEDKDDSGNRFVRFQQISDGIPVTQGRIAVQMGTDGAVRAILGELIPNARAVAATTDGRATIQSALAGIGASNLVIHEGPLAAVFRDKKGTAVNAWQAIVEYEGAQGRALEDVFISQSSGEILGRYTKIHQALNREVYDMNQTCIITRQELPGRLLMSEGSASADGAAMGAYDGVGNTYWFYKHQYIARGQRRS